MINLENFEVVGWEYAIRGMRNPMNSWNKSDSVLKIMDDTECSDSCYLGDHDKCDDCYLTSMAGCIIGSEDHDLMMKLRNAGTDHRKFMRMITVYVDITAPLYWWKEFDTYKVGTVANSCSTMHKIHEKEFTWGDFSCEHLINFGMWEKDGFIESDATYAHAKVMGLVISSLNGARDRYLNYKSRGPEWESTAKQAWWQMIQLLPSSYNQKRTIMLNYEVLANIYKSRRGHKLDEWREFCAWIERLPYSELITGARENEQRGVSEDTAGKSEEFMKKVVLSYHECGISDLRKIMYDFIDELLLNGIEVCDDCRMGMLVHTPHVTIRFVNPWSNLSGVRCNEVFGVSNTVRAQELRRDHRLNGFDGTLLEYVLKEERVNENM